MNEVEMACALRIARPEPMAPLRARVSFPSLVQSPPRNAPVEEPAVEQSSILCPRRNHVKVVLRPQLLQRDKVVSVPFHRVVTRVRVVGASRWGGGRVGDPVCDGEEAFSSLVSYELEPPDDELC